VIHLSLYLNFINFAFFEDNFVCKFSGLTVTEVAYDYQEGIMNYVEVHKIMEL